MADMETLPQISPQAALNLVRNMAEGLLTLHRKNIFHGGITPKLICLREDGGDALLLPINIYPGPPPVDMGDFASPEWVTGAETTFTPGMDIYALGLALYILLTRKTPMEAGFAMPSSLIKCSDAVWIPAVSRAINPDTRERYRDLGDFITDLDKAIANPAGRNAASIPPPPSSPAIPGPEHAKRAVQHLLLSHSGPDRGHCADLYSASCIRRMSLECTIIMNRCKRKITQSGSGKTSEQGRAATLRPPRKRRCGVSFTCSGRASGAGAGSSQSLRGTRQSQLEPSARRQGSPEFQPQHAGSLRSGKGR